MSTPYAPCRTLVVLCVIALSAGCTYGNGVEEEYAKSFSVSDHADVHIHVANARVHVVSSNDASVQFHVSYEIEGQDWQPFATRQQGNLIELREERRSHDWWNWDGDRIERAMIDVRMPKNADLELQTSNGAIEVSSVEGDIRLHTSNGAIHASAIKGKLHAGSSNGSIDADGLDGECELSTSNGRIQASGRFDSLNIHSSNGLVVARAETGSTVSSPWSLGTSNSPIDLSVPSDLKADLDLGTSNGGVQLDLPVTVQGNQDRTHLHGTMNGGGTEVSVHTSNGHIRVRGL